MVSLPLPSPAESQTMNALEPESVQSATGVLANTGETAPTKAKVVFEQVDLFELEVEEARDTDYLRKLLEPHYPAATDAKFEYKQEGDCLIVTMIKQNPPKG